MVLPTTLGYDVTAENYQARPLAGHPALYVTGTSDIIATPAMLAANPGAITINQSGGSVVADFYDVEAGAITIAELPGLIRQAREARLLGNGRRNPGPYMSAANVTAVVNELVTAKMTNVPLWVADWNLSVNEAITQLQASSGPYPVVGYQYNNAGTHDDDVWLTSWVNATSAVGVQYDWAWCLKCKGLFFGPQQSASHCPAGGQHDGSRSFDYGLAWRVNTTS